MFEVAYYYEHMPWERPEKEVRMMKKTGINIVRIDESAWSTIRTAERCIQRVVIIQICINGPFD
jgi:beta-galactosidase